MQEDTSADKQEAREEEGGGKLQLGRAVKGVSKALVTGWHQTCNRGQWEAQGGSVSRHTGCMAS